MGEEPFERVLENYEPLLKALIKRYNLQSQYDEMYQVASIALWESYQSFDDTKGVFPAYAKSYVTGKILNSLSKENRFAERHVTYAPDSVLWEQRIEDSAAPILEGEITALYMEGLSPRQRIWVQEGLLLGKKSTDIAKEKHVSADTVRTWKKEALKKMRRNALNLS
jgi:RNA polymerase sigma factor (sigma-70 family)